MDRFAQRASQPIDHCELLCWMPLSRQILPSRGKDKHDKKTRKTSWILSGLAFWLSLPTLDSGWWTRFPDHLCNLGLGESPNASTSPPKRARSPFPASDGGACTPFNLHCIYNIFLASALGNCALPETGLNFSQCIKQPVSEILLQGFDGINGEQSSTATPVALNKWREAALTTVDHFTSQSGQVFKWQTSE